jgi:hypothetical protein
LSAQATVLISPRQLQETYENMRNMTKEEQAARYNHGRDLVNTIKTNPTSIHREYDWEEVWRLNRKFLTTA